MLYYATVSLRGQIYYYRIVKKELHVYVMTYYNTSVSQRKWTYRPDYIDSDQNN